MNIFYRAQVLKTTDRNGLIEQDSVTPRWWHHIYQTLDSHVVHVDLSENNQFEEKAFLMLDQQERKRASLFFSNNSKRQFILCRAALRANLCSLYDLKNSDLRIFAERNEKPRATVRDKPVSIQFNVSHSFDHGLLAFARSGRIGVDIEDRHHRPHIDEILYLVFSSKEQHLLRHSSGTKRRQVFFRLWTFKEALIKATGEGFRRDTSAFSIPEPLLSQTHTANMSLSDMPDVVWKIVNLETDQFAAAIAHELVE